MAETWQSAPDAPGLWWRDGGDGPVAWEVRKCAAGTKRLYAQEVVGEMDLAEILDLSPRTGVRWLRCLPPEILAPGEPTRAEILAQLATVTAERAAAEDIARQWIDGAAEANKTISDLHAQLAAALRRRGTLHDVATLRIRVESLEVALRDACEWVGTRDDFIPRVINVLRGANVADERAERATRERDDAHAQLAAVTRERDVLRAQQAPLLDAHDALVAAARAAGWTGAGATGAELVAWVRRGERERCDDVITARLGEAVREVREKTYRGTGAERDTAAAVRDAIEAVRDMIREGGE